jgi:PAS domain S-box-containing protein
MASPPEILDLFFQNAIDLLCVAGMDGHFKRINPAWTGSLGWSEAELLATPWLDFVHPDDRLATLAAGAELAAGRKVAAFENRYRHKDGSWRRLRWNSQPLAGGLIAAVVRDITEAHGLRERLSAAEAEMAAVLQHAPFGFYLYELRADRSLVLTRANAAADRFTGIDTSPLIGLEIERAFPQLAAVGIPDRYRAVADGSAPAYRMVDLPYDDGRIRGSFDVWVFRVGTSHVAVFFIETTERRNQEEALRQSREDLRITLDSIGDGVIAADRSARVTRINRVAEQLTGWTAAEAIGRHIDEVFDIVNAETGKRVESPVSRVLREGQVVGLANHTALVRKDGIRVQIADSGAPIRDSDGGIAGVVLVFRDVTEEYALQRQLHHAQKMEAVGQLAGGIAHDFNNLLGGILGAAEMIGRRCPLEPRGREWLAMITGSATRAAELTQKLLAFGRKGQAQTVAIDLKSLLHQVAGILEHTLDRNITLRLDLPSAPVWTKGDPSQIQSAVLNLAINARDAMPGGGTLRISLASAELLAAPPCRHQLGQIEPGPCAAIAVSDTGCGIPGELIERIFEPFFTTKGPGQGSGLGLASVFSAAKNHAGAVTVDSDPGRGSSFTIYLPLAPATGPAAAEPPAASPGEGRGHGRRILVIDDEPAIRDAVAAWLEDDGYQVQTAADGEAGLRCFAAAAQPFDIILLDLVMPGKSGPEVFRAMRSRNPDVRVVLMSGYNLHGAKADALLAEGAAGFMQKPFRFEDLSAAIRRLHG